MHRRRDMNAKRMIGLSITVALAAIVLTPRDARAQEERDEESTAMRANRGLRIGIGPMLLFPVRENGPYGAGLELEGRYGIKLGPTVVAPGGTLGGYVLSSRFIGEAMPTLRWTLPIGPIAPYGLGGVGFGWLTNPNNGGVAAMAGGGLTVHFGEILAIGAELTYRTITNTEYRGWVAGPTLYFGG
jgi:hypothetical protein